MKNKNKRALRVCHSDKEAADYIVNWMEKNPDKKDKLSITIRPGETTRCERWCKAAPWCDQYQEELGCLDLTS